MSTNFQLLSPLFSLDPISLGEMIGEIEAPVRSRTSAWVVELLEPLRDKFDIPVGREALIVNDPYFIGVAHGRIRFDRNEIVANLVKLISVPAETMIMFDDVRGAIVVRVEGNEASRDAYDCASAASPKDIAQIEIALNCIASIPAYYELVAAGTRRLAISANCIGSSSISSLPGYAMVEWPSELDSPRNRQINGLVHEAVHGLLFLAECAVGQQLVRSDNRATIISPWSGNPLDSYQFVQAVMVWYLLLSFWQQLDPNSNEYRAAAIGFAFGNPALQEIRRIGREVNPDYLALIGKCSRNAAQFIAQ